jgi:hypothetical protein
MIKVSAAGKDEEQKNNFLLIMITLCQVKKSRNVKATLLLGGLELPLLHYWLHMINGCVPGAMVMSL